MKKQKSMEERIKRVKILFKELGYRIHEDQLDEDTYTAGFENKKGINGSLVIDDESHFLEIGYTFSFSLSLSEFLKTRLEAMLEICYEFGCYTSIQKSDDEIAFSIFSKIYFSGLNYYSLKENLKDFIKCIVLLTKMIDIKNSEIQDEETL